MEITPEILARLAPTLEGMPVFLDTSPPDVEDPSQQLTPHQWMPGCASAGKLTRCLEAVRDASTALGPLRSAIRPDADKRLVKQVITPIYNLAIAIRDLFNYVQSNHWTAFDKKRQAKLVKRFEQFKAAVPTGCGPLKIARDKISAHLDKDVSTSEYRKFWDSFGISDVLGWVKGCLKLLHDLILPNIYSWTRCSGYSNVRNIMNDDGMEVSILVKDGVPEAFVGARLAPSPKAAIMEEVDELARACMSLEQRLGIAG